MPYPPDPGGVFDSDVHRRVAAIMANTEQNGGEDLDMDQIYAGITSDDHLSLGYDEAGQVVSELEGHGHGHGHDGKHGLTDAGLIALTHRNTHGERVDT